MHAAPPDPGHRARLERRGALVVAVSIAAYAATYLAISAIKYRYYLYKDIDLAIFVQAVSGILHGSLASSVRGMPWLGDHASLVLFAIAPLYAIARHPLTLLAIQTLALALGAWPVYRIARRELPGVLLPVVAAELYLLYPAVGYSNLFEFHPETLATGALVAALDAWCAERLAPTLAWSAAALACREDVALVTLGLGLLSLRPGRSRRLAFAGGLASLAVLSLALDFGVLRRALNSGEAEYGRMYAAWGADPPAILRGLLAHPVRALNALVATPGNPTDTLIKRQYPIHLLLPLGGLPLLAPSMLIPALPIALEHLLSERRHQHTIVFHYTALVTPFVIVAAVLGMRRALAIGTGAGGPAALTRRARALGLALLAVSLACNLMFGPLVGRGTLQRAPRNESVLPGEYDRTLAPYRDRMLRRVPGSGTVVAGFEFLPRLADRTALHSLHHILTGRFTYSQRAYPPPTDVRAVIADLAAQIPSLAGGGERRLHDLLATNDLHAVAAAGSTVLFLRGARDTIELSSFGPEEAAPAARFIADDQLACLGADPLPATVERGGLLTLRSHWRRVGPATRDYLVNVQVTPEDGAAARRIGRVRPLAHGLLPLSDWPQDRTLTDAYPLDVSTSLPPGVYRVGLTAMALDSTGRSVATTLRTSGPGAERLDFGTIRVTARAH